jgi:AcrR family transcriptional regulator
MLENQSFKKITVNDICQHAMISRSAFYLHFGDKYDLLRYCVENEIKRWESAMQDGSIEEFLVFVLNAILEKKKFYYNTLVSEPSQEITDIFHRLFSGFISKRIERLKVKGKSFPGDTSVVSAFYAGGIVCSTVQWIRGGFAIPIDEMARCQKYMLRELEE